MSRKLPLAFTVASCLLLSGLKLSAQWTISGTTCVATNTQYQYGISNGWTNGTSMTWTCSGCTFTSSSSGTPLPYVDVKWTGSGWIKVQTSNPGGSYTLDVSIYPTLVPGSITSGGGQAINYNTTPASIVCSGASGGYCTSPNFTYQWYSSTDDVNFTSMSGQTSLTLSFGATTLTQTMYYKIKVTETNSGSTAWYPVATVTVYPQLVSGTITPATQTINFNRSPSALTVSGTSGGNLSYSYSWQYCSTSNGTYTTVSNTNSTTFHPSPITSNTWYEVVQTSNGVPVTSAPVEAIVNPQVFPGVITPAFQTITSGTSPDTLTSTEGSGGTCGSFSYQWQSSTNDSTWANVTGATTLLYEPGTLTSTMYYRVMVICSTDTEYTGSAEVAVGSTSPSLNFIRTRTILKPGVMDTVTADGLASPYDVAQTTEYFDNLGDVIQTVSMQASPLQNDMVTPMVYDNFGRRQIQLLPYTATTNDGNYKPTALTDQINFNAAQFPGEQYYYSQTNYEPSPLNRVLESFAPGQSWVGNNAGVSTQYLINAVSDSVQIWQISSTQLSLPVDEGAYQAGQLLKYVVTDEQGHQVVEYKDKLGKVILKKVQQAASPSTGHFGWLCTYYVYDTLQNPRVIIQPQAVALINGSWVVNQTIANQLCFRYEYDGRRRLTIKKVPGAGQVWLVHDARDRVVMTQDSLMHNQQKWMYTKYDLEDRIDSTGFITDPTYYDSLAHYDTLAYHSTNFPTVSSYTNQLLTQNFYDDYSWVSTYSAPVASSMATTYIGNSTYFITTYNTSPTYAYKDSAFAINRGMPTGSMKLVVAASGSSQYLYTSIFYDDRGRVLQIQSSNYTGSIDTLTTQYNFDGALLRTLLNHQKGLNTTQNHLVVTKMDYDQRFRLRHIWKNIDNAASDQLIDSLQYNELGQLIAKYLGNQVDSVIYSYNIRGWLTGINKSFVAGTASHYFGMELGYNSTSSVAPGNTYLNPELNGNVEGVVWKSAGSQINRKYDFTYDPANRLTSAAFLQNSGGGWNKDTIDYSVSGISYDANGNLLTMTQRGFTIGGSTPIDSLTYNYLGSDSSNVLMGVTDAANNDSTKLEDFHYNPATKQSTDYNYDVNGNQTHDNNKNIDTISYNYMNLPQSVHIKGEGNVAYTYDAAGGKLLKVITDSIAQRVTTITYISGFAYQRTAPLSNPTLGTDTLQYIGHEEGRARWAYKKYDSVGSGYSFQYDFFERDHLGNTRMVLTQERDTSLYRATMEAANRTTEEQLFGNIPNTCVAWTSMPNYANIPSGVRYMYGATNDSVSKVDSSSAGGQKTGPSLLLKVMSGDSVNISVQCYYTTPGGGSTNYSMFSDVLTSLANGLVNLTGGAHGEVGNLTSSSSNVYTGLTSFLNGDDTAHTGYPQAYINYIFLDDQFNYVSSLSGTVLAASANNPANQMNLVALGSKLALNRNGYLYIWVSNQTSGWDVYFDNLSVQYQQGPLLEENHYYPFGLTMAGISDKAIKTDYSENKFRFNQGTELQNKEFADGTGLEMYDAGFRTLDPQLGRFPQIDPLAGVREDMSPYNFGMDNPIYFNDPSGMKAAAPGPYSPYLQDYLNSLADPLGHQLGWGLSFLHGGGGGDAIGGPDYTVGPSALGISNYSSFYSRLKAMALSLPGDVTFQFPTVSGNPSALTIYYTYTGMLNGVPTPFVGVSLFNFAPLGWGNSGILSWKSFNFQSMGPNSKFYEAGVTGLNWDIVVWGVDGAKAHRFINFPTIYVQFPKTSGIGTPYIAAYANIMTAQSMNEAIASVNFELEFAGPANLEALPEDVIIAAFMEATELYINGYTWEIGTGTVSSTYSGGLNTVVTPAKWMTPLP